MLLSLIHWKPPGTLPKSAFPLQKQREGSVCVRNTVSEGFESSPRTCPVQILHTRETILYDSTETQRLTGENIQRENAELEQTESLSPPSHSLFLSPVSSSQLYVCDLLFSWSLLLFLVPFLPVIFSVFHSPAPAYLFIPGSPCLSPLPPSHSLSPLIAHAFTPLRLPAH